MSTKQMTNEDVIIKHLQQCLPGKAAAPLDEDGSLLLYIWKHNLVHILASNETLQLYNSNQLGNSCLVYQDMHTYT